MPDDFFTENLTESRPTPDVIGQSDSITPVHINVGGITYTSCLKTLTKFPHSKLAKQFNGSLPITLDPLNHHYVLDRDGKMFRHILNFLRNSELIIPDNFSEINLLKKEAQFFELEDMCKAMEADQQETCGESSTENTNHQRRKVRKKTRTKKAAQPTAAQVTENEEENSDEVEGVIDGRSTDKYDIIHVEEVKPLEEVSTVGERFICVVTSRDKVEELWTSDKDFNTDFEHVTPHLKLVKKSQDQMLGSNKFELKNKCSLCRNLASYHTIVSHPLYITSGELSVCYVCYNKALEKNKLADMYNINLVDAELVGSWPKHVGLPSVAKYLLKLGYKLVTCSAYEGKLYNYFVKH